MSQLRDEHDPAIWSQLCYDDDTCVRYLHLPVLGYKALAADSSALLLWPSTAPTELGEEVRRPDDDVSTLARQVLDAPLTHEIGLVDLVGQTEAHDDATCWWFGVPYQRALIRPVICEAPLQEAPLQVGFLRAANKAGEEGQVLILRGEGWLLAVQQLREAPQSFRFPPATEPCDPAELVAPL